VLPFVGPPLKRYGVRLALRSLPFHNPVAARLWL
jgi:hypothetical protein